MADNLILDTCGLIWLSMGGGELSEKALKTIQDAQNVFVSSISAFEISLKYHKGGIELPCDPEKWFSDILTHHDISEIAIDRKIAITSTKLPFLHNDPCDRFIIATAILNNLTIVTADILFYKYKVNILQ